jgi:uncharacterized protein
VPFTEFTIAVRCPFGGPAVLENGPRDLKGRPFPTRYWLSCRALSSGVSRLEAQGGVRALEGDASMQEAVQAAHVAHAARHEGYRVGGVGEAGRVKCLHAHLAFALATGGNPVGDWIAERGALEWPSTCCAEAPPETAA